jgi:ppGpp synthetase/RelA/SpoT-type nucleotidyltranferase
MTKLSEQFKSIEPALTQLDTEVLHQLERIISNSTVVLAHPIEHRVKTLPSILEKIDRNGFSEDANLTELTDLVGYRLVLLFRRDLGSMQKLLESNFQVVTSENVSDRLSDTQFGYQSIHCICKILPEWRKLPSFTGLDNFGFEIQVRTAAQHIWAAASHKLQYKVESSVPGPLRRTIHRVAALLETVDLEFERVLLERENYEAEAPQANPEEINVVSLEQFLKSFWPKKNWKEGKASYDVLTQNLLDWGVANISQLKELLEKHKEAAYSEDKMRLKRGHEVYNHVGLTRSALSEEFGKLWHMKQPNKIEAG